MVMSLIGMLGVAMIASSGVSLEKGAAEMSLAMERVWEMEETLLQKQDVETIIRSYAPNLSSETVQAYAEAIITNSNEYNVDPVLVTAMIWQESRFRHDAISNKGARGLLQIMPRTARGMGIDPDRLFEPSTNLKAGIEYLSKLRKKYGNLRLGIIAYNQGEGNVSKSQYTPHYYTRVMAHYDQMNRLLRSKQNDFEQAGRR